MSSAGAQCDHIAHVSTQMPYAMLVAGVSFFGYILCGALQGVLGIWTAAVALPVCLAALIGVLLFLSKKSKKA